MLIFLVTTFLLTAPVLFAQSRREEFLNVKSWRGSFDMSVNTQGESNGVKWTYQGTATGQLVHDTPDLENVRWLGKVSSSSVNIKSELSWSDSDCSFTGTFLYSGPLDPVRSGSETQVRVFLNVWDLTLSRAIITATYTKKTVCPNYTNTVVTQPGGMIPTLSPLQFPYPPQGLSLEGRGKAPAVTGVPGSPRPLQLVDWDVHFRLDPAVDDLLLEVTSAEYDTWRPTAEPGPNAGQPIQFTAVVKRASGAAAQINVSRFVWELVDTSHEPGIAMNFPLDAKDRDPDLKFDPQPGQFVTGADNQKIERPVPESPQDSAVVLPYDWGAWSTLQVTAFLSDGGKLVGKLKGSQEENVRLPKRAKDSFIADAWRAAGRGRTGKDSDDSETDPAGLEGCKGDGLTLYQEYRGFIENGKHIEGNPEKKDFFILNLVGGDAESGIALFTYLSELEVHKDLTEQEFFFQNRLINGNRDRGPHRVDQHGVFLVSDQETSGAEARFTESGVSGRPGITTGILVQPRGAEGGSFSKPYNLSAMDQSETYDIGVAHELFHTVGVDHHGDGDRPQMFRLVCVGDPKNTLGRPYFETWGLTVEVIDEKSGQDQAQIICQQAKPEYDKARKATERRYGDDPEFLKGVLQLQEMLAWEFTFMVGERGHEHSGDDGCVMRYFFAKVYPAEGKQNRYYLVPQGTEPLGKALCTLSKGTGVNGSREPQPRYWDATRGKCRSQVCPNDAIPPTKQ